MALPVRIVGKRFGRLTVLAPAANRGKRRMSHCACDCGNFTTTRNFSLTSGETLSCGCLHHGPTSLITLKSKEARSLPLPVSKLCRYCSKIKELSEFSERRASVDGRGHKCRECANQYRMDNREHYIALKQKWDRESNWHKTYYPQHRADYVARCAARRSGVLLRTPTWLTKKQKQEIRCFYTQAEMLKSTLGVDFNVDHVVPLHGKNVSGLHVPWNLQVILASVNKSKGNRHASYN